MDLFMGGTETTSKSIEWSVYYLIKYSHYQERMYEELKCITDNNNRLISMEDKMEANFFNALFEEVMRHSSMVTLIPGHTSTKDEMLDGLVIPKGTPVGIILYNYINRNFNVLALLRCFP